MPIFVVQYKPLPCVERGVCQESTLFWRFVRVVQCASGLLFLTAVYLIRQRFVSSAVYYLLLVAVRQFDFVAIYHPERFRGSGLLQVLKIFLKGKKNGVNIFKSINEGPFQMGTFRETLAEGEEGALHLGLERSQVYFNLSHDDKERYNADILADECDAFNFDVDEAPTAQTMFMANLSSADPVYDEASPSYDSGILSEYVKDKAELVVQNNVSSVPNDTSTMIINEMHEPTTQCVSVKAHTKVVDASLTAEIAIYREQVELYERRAKFELHEREQKIEEQLRILIIDCNIKEANLKKKLHSVEMQLNSTIKHNKTMVEEVMSLKKDFKQKENKYLEEFLDMKALKEKVKDTLFKQDHSLQIVYMLCKPKPYYDEQRKVAIGYKNPLCLTRAKQVQHALYNGHEIIKFNHVPTIVHNLKDTLEIAEITRKKMNDKMKTPLWTEQNINIQPLDYSKENYLVPFTPHTQLTPEHIFWSKDVLKIKAKALKEQTKASKLIKALMVYPPNTPAMLVLRVLPTTSQVKINIFALIQLFLEFKKPVKKNYTNGEHFEGIQKALTKEIKEIFEELEAEGSSSRLSKTSSRSVATLREIVEEARAERPLDRSLASACLYTKLSQELLEYVVGTYPKDFSKRDKKQATTAFNRKKQLTFENQWELSNNNTLNHVEQLNI
nr:hypothetical protein [Tanacetum cinerariifolium]